MVNAVQSVALPYVSMTIFFNLTCHGAAMEFLPDC